MGERELADDTGLARSAYMSSESALRTELLLDDADDTDETLLTLKDLKQFEKNGSSQLCDRNGTCQNVCDTYFFLQIHPK